MLRLTGLAALLALASTPVRAEDAGPFDVLSHDLRLTLDPEARAVSGEQTIRLRLREAASEVSFSDNAFEIAGARVRRERGRLFVALPRAGRAGETFTLRLSYRGRPRRGLIFEPALAYTSYFACDWMICDLERPGDKARLRLKLNAPDGWRIAPMLPGDRPLSAFLYGFAAGALAEVRLPGRRDLRAFSGDLGREELEDLFAPTSAMVAFFEATAGMSLPARPYWQLHTPGPEAQEGANFALIGSTQLLPMRTAPDEDWAIAHELAHQWWGALITCETWNEAWLNEGFAVFMTAVWKEHRWGRTAYDREMALARRRLAASAAAGFDKPLAWSGTYPSLQVRRGVQYSKGALFLNALRTRLGDEAFWQAIRLYTRRNAGGTVTSADFQAAVEHVAPGRTNDLFADWVFGHDK